MTASTTLSRRTVLKIGASALLASLAARRFAGLIAESLADDDRILLLYGTKYGATRDTAQWIADGLQRPVELVDIRDSGNPDGYGEKARFILGSAVFTEGPMRTMCDYIREHASVLNGRVVATFVVCGSSPDSEKGQARIASYLSQLNAPLRPAPTLSRAFGGRLMVAKLTDEDRDALTRYYAIARQQPLADWDRTDPRIAAQFADQLRGSVFNN